MCIRDRYKITINVPNNITQLKDFSLTDKPTGLEDMTDSDFSVKCNDAEITNTDNSVYTLTKNDDTKGFTISFVPTAMCDYAGQQIVITYNAKLLDTAAVSYTHLDLNSESHWCNWTEGQDKVYFGIVQSNYAVREGDYDSTAKFWRWKIANLNLPSSGTVNLFFTYSNDWEGKIKQKPYYRTAEYTMEVSSIGGKVFVQKNVTSSDVIDKQPVYALKELSSYAGKTDVYKRQG